MAILLVRCQRMVERIQLPNTALALVPGVITLAGLVTVALAWGTVAYHAFKVARTNPIFALRYE